MCVLRRLAFSLSPLLAWRGVAWRGGVGQLFMREGDPTTTTATHVGASPGEALFECFTPRWQLSQVRHLRAHARVAAARVPRRVTGWAQGVCVVCWGGGVLRALPCEFSHILLFSPLFVFHVSTRFLMSFRFAPSQGRSPLGDSYRYKSLGPIMSPHHVVPIMSLPSCHPIM